MKYQSTKDNFTLNVYGENYEDFQQDIQEISKKYPSIAVIVDEYEIQLSFKNKVHAEEMEKCIIDVYLHVLIEHEEIEYA